MIQLDGIDAATCRTAGLPCQNPSNSVLADARLPAKRIGGVLLSRFSRSLSVRLWAKTPTHTHEARQHEPGHHKLWSFSPWLEEFSALCSRGPGV